MSLRTRHRRCRSTISKKQELATRKAESNKLKNGATEILRVGLRHAYKDGSRSQQPQLEANHKKIAVAAQGLDLPPKTSGSGWQVDPFSKSVTSSPVDARLSGQVDTLS